MTLPRGPSLLLCEERPGRLVAEMTGSEARLFSFNICLFVAALSLRCCVWPLSRLSGRELSFIARCRPLVAAAPLIWECGLEGATDSAALLGSGRPAACGVFPDQAWSLCPLH